MASRGSLVEAIDAAVETLTASTAFQGRCGVDNPTAAEARIALDTLTDNDGLKERRPFAILKIATRGSNQVGEGIVIDLVAGGGVIVYLTDNSRSDEHSQSYRDFLEFAGMTIDDMERSSGFDMNLPFHDSEMILPPQRTQRSERQVGSHDYWEVAFLVHFGDRE